MHEVRDPLKAAAPGIFQDEVWSRDGMIWIKQKKSRLQSMIA
jgi:hypothetical protein